jgi:hypothetical protein
MAFYGDPHRPRVSIPRDNGRYPGWQYPATNPSNQTSAPYAFEVTPTRVTEFPSLENPWPDRLAPPDTSLVRMRSMVELSGRSQSSTSPVTQNGHLAFPEPQLTRSVSHNPAQQPFDALRHRPSMNEISFAPSGLHRQISTASSYWEDHGAESGPEVRI